MLQSLLNNFFQQQKALNRILLSAFFISLLLISLVSCENSLDEIKSLESGVQDLSESSSKDVKIHFSDSGQAMVTLKAPELERYTTKDIPYDLMPKGLTIDFYDSVGHVEANVTCNYAIHYPKQNILELSNDVVVVNREGDKLNSERLVWNANTQKISSQDFVKITTKDEIIYGDGLIANQDFTEYEISHIKGIISIEDEDL